MIINHKLFFSENRARNTPEPQFNANNFNSDALGFIILTETILLILTKSVVSALILKANLIKALLATIQTI